VPGSSRNDAFAAVMLPHLDAACNFDDEIPRDAFAGIEIEDEQVRVLYVVDRSLPRMDLDHADLHEPEQAGEIIDP